MPGLVSAPWVGLLIPLLFGVSVFLFALSLLPTKNVLSEQLEELKARDPYRRDDLQSPLLQRVFTQERRMALGMRLAESGWYTTTPTKFALRIVAGALFRRVRRHANLALLRTRREVLGAAGCLHHVHRRLPPVLHALTAQPKRAKVRFRKALPEFLDMVASTVQAGLALNSALAYAVEAVPGPIGEEIKEALSQIRLGRARADALRAVGERTNHPALRNALRVMTQAERLGANIAKMLTDLAEDARHQRIMLVEEMAAKLPVKMVFPMVFFMIPAIVTIIFGAVAANYFAGTPK